MKVKELGHIERLELEIIVGLLGNSDLVILDCSFEGMNPRFILVLNNILRAITARGSCVIVVSNCPLPFPLTNSQLIYLTEGAMTLRGNKIELIESLSEGVGVLIITLPVLSSIQSKSSILLLALFHKLR